MLKFKNKNEEFRKRFIIINKRTKMSACFNNSWKRQKVHRHYLNNDNWASNISRFVAKYFDRRKGISNYQHGSQILLGNVSAN
jgi:hypothetical protein